MEPAFTSLCQTLTTVNAHPSSKPTTWLAVRSSDLSERRMVELTGIEPVTFTMP